MKIFLAGCVVLLGTIGQLVAFAAIPVEARDAALGAGPLAWSWLVGFVAAVLVAILLICAPESVR